ncbi:MAG: SGNH/GDSL hydrolase family protein, partial [Rhodobacteraceae bacterium]|nr:SGNH/GDSL hydrolase family protein [Paracoccaceae bacterium]
ALGFWIGAGQAPPPGDRPLAPRPLPPGPVRIALLGTSLTDHALWPDRVTQRLATCGITAFIDRHARPGANSRWGRSVAAELAQSAPDIILIEFAINDADLHDGLSLSDSADSHADILRQLRQPSPADPAIFLLTTNPVSGWARLLRPRLAAYQALYGRLATQYQTGLVDGYGRWLATPGWADQLLDHLHPAPERESAILTPAITLAIGRLYGRDCPY